MTNLMPRDCVVLSPGNSLPVKISDDLRQSGWPGGQGVMWAGAGTVTRSDGLCAGYLPSGSGEVGYNYLSDSGSSQSTGVSELYFGGAIVQTRTFERFTFASRQLGPLVPLVYSEQDTLYFSTRGFFTKEDEATILGLPRGPNPSVGKVARVQPEFLYIQVTL